MLFYNILQFESFLHIMVMQNVVTYFKETKNKPNWNGLFSHVLLYFSFIGYYFHLALIFMLNWRYVLDVRNIYFNYLFLNKFARKFKYQNTICILGDT